MNTTTSIELTVTTTTSHAPKRPRVVPAAHTKASHLFEITEASQKEVAERFQVRPQAVHRCERAAMAKIRRALLAEPEIVVDYDPVFARRHGIKPGAVIRRISFGGHYIPEELRNKLASFRARARRWDYIATNADCPEDAAEAQEAADAIRQEIGLLELAVSKIP